LYYKILISSRAATIRWWERRFDCHAGPVAALWGKIGSCAPVETGLYDPLCKWAGGRGTEAGGDGQYLGGLNSSSAEYGGRRRFELICPRAKMQLSNNNCVAGMKMMKE